MTCACLNFPLKKMFNTLSTQGNITYWKFNRRQFNHGSLFFSAFSIITRPLRILSHKEKISWRQTSWMLFKSCDDDFFPLLTNFRLLGPPTSPRVIWSWKQFWTCGFNFLGNWLNDWIFQGLFHFVQSDFHYILSTIHYIIFMIFLHRTNVCVK
jgi:hypothetical protein